MPCPACQSTDITIEPGAIAPFVAHRTGVHNTTTGICRNCTLRYSTTRWTDQQAAQLYANYRSSEYDTQRRMYEPGYDSGPLNATRNYLADIETFIEILPATILDIGGNDGGNTPFQHSAHITIMEIGDPEPEHTYDLVILAHVLEHAAAPRDLIDLARRHRNRTGRIYVEVPIEPPSTTWHEHIQQFNEASLAALLDHQHHAIRTTWTRLGPVLMAIT